MFCKKCGKEVNDDAVVCIHCGCSLKEDENKKEMNESKTGIGVLMGLFLGIIGLVIGICMYPAGTLARKTFLKAWGITFGVCVAILVVCYIIILCVAGSMISQLPY